MLSYYPSSTCIILHHSSYRALLSDIGLALVFQKRLEIGQVNWFRFSARLSSPRKTKRTIILFSISTKVIKQIWRVILSSAYHKYHPPIASRPHSYSSLRVIQPILTTYTVTNNVSPCFSHSANWGGVKGPMSKDVLRGLALLCFPPTSPKHGHR